MKLNYEIIAQYESSDHHVFISKVTSKTVNKQDGFTYACGDVVTILKIVDNKIISHIDYADYVSFMKSGKDSDSTCHKF